ncbi:unnamed protein product [Alopecurus aequalis]
MVYSRIEAPAPRARTSGSATPLHGVLPNRVPCTYDYAKSRARGDLPRALVGGDGVVPLEPSSAPANNQNSYFSFWRTEQDSIFNPPCRPLVGTYGLFDHPDPWPSSTQRKLHTAAARSSIRPKTSSAQTNGHQGCISQGAEIQSPFEKLAEDVLHLIHSLLLVRDAARAACVSGAFRHTWRCYSKLIINYYTVGVTNIKYDSEERNINLVDKVNKILKNHYHKGVKVETLNLDISPCSNIKASCLDRWLRRTIKSGIKEVNLRMPIYMKKSYNFPCSVLSDEGAASSIQSLHLSSCNFHPTSALGCLRRLKILSLWSVHTTEEGLEHLLSKSSTLEELRFCFCSGIICLKIPHTMQHLKLLDVKRCDILDKHGYEMPRVVEIDAPNLSSFQYDGALPEISVGNSLQLKHVNLSFSHMSGNLFYARTSLPSIARHIESLILVSCSENANTPMLQSKLPHLKNLEIRLRAGFSTSYDVSSLVSFLDASPALESFTLHVDPYAMSRHPVVGDDDECPRPKLDFWHNRLRQVKITGFCSAKSLVELTVYILESTRSLERLTLDTTRDYDRRVYGIGKCPNSRKIGRCWPMSKEELEEAHRAVKTARRYINGRVPLAVQFEVLEPCSRCHTGNQ